MRHVSSGVAMRPHSAIFAVVLGGCALVVVGLGFASAYLNLLLPVEDSAVAALNIASVNSGSIPRSPHDIPRPQSGLRLRLTIKVTVPKVSSALIVGTAQYRLSLDYKDWKPSS